MKDERRFQVYFTLGTHLDLFWMGDTRDCLDRGVEVIDTALDLCEEHPEYCFFVETTVFMEYYLQHRPDAKRRVEKLMATGQFEISGVYVDRVEHTNSGESLIRENVYGQRWLMKTFGKESLSVCHVDLPGLSPQIPQICEGCGIKYYLRARGDVGIYNWKAPNGSSVVYVDLGYDYSRLSGIGTSEYTKVGIGQYLEEKKASGRLFLRGGYGDLSMPDAEIIDVVEGLRKHFPDIDFQIASPGKVLSEVIRGDVAAGLPVISGEWPFGWGDRSSSSLDNFRLNAELQNLLMTTEKFAVFAGLLGHGIRTEIDKAEWWVSLGRIKGEIKAPPIPAGMELEEAWKPLLYVLDHNNYGFSGHKNEFDKGVMQREAVRYANSILDNSLADISGHIAPASAHDGRQVVVFNPLSWDRDGLAVLDLAGLENADNVALVDEAGKSARIQRVGSQAYAWLEGVPSVGYRAYILRDAWRAGGKAGARSGGHAGPEPFSVSKRKGREVIENELLTVELDIRTGTLARLRDRRLDKEIVVGHGFGAVRSWEDPGSSVIYQFTGKVVDDTERDFELVDATHGPIFSRYLLRGSIVQATLEKEIIIHHLDATVDMNITLYWWGKRGEHLRLQMPFNPEGHASTSYGVPFYTMEYPSMMAGVDDEKILRMGLIKSDELKPPDRKHFREILRWFDLGYRDWGVAVATDVSGVRIDEHSVEPILLRTQYSCGDRNCWSDNQGRHTMHFSIHPHKGSWRESRGFRHGWEQANPLIVRSSGSGAPVSTPAPTRTLPPAMSFVTPSRGEVVVHTVKPAYDRPGDVAVRLYEACGTTGEVELTFSQRVTKAVETDMLERPTQALSCRDNRVSVPVRPYDIKTLVVTFAKT